MTNRILVLMLLAASFHSCAQNNTTMEKSIKDIYKTVQHRDQAIEYRANIQVGACSFEFLINDVPVQSYFENANGTFNVSAPFNDAILASGIQRWKLILYPAYKDRVQTEVLSPNILIDIEVEGLRHTAESVRTVYGPVSLITTPVKENDKGEEVFEHAGAPVAIYEGTFEAKVPYKLSGWSESKDLSKEDQEQLLVEVLRATQAYANCFKSKDTVGVTNLVYNKEVEYQQANFCGKEDSEEQWKYYLENFNLPDAIVQPIENYKMRIYGDGRLVTLERNDFPYIGEPVVRINYMEGNRKMISYLFATFHKPKGSDKLEIIR